MDIFLWFMLIIILVLAEFIYWEDIDRQINDNTALRVFYNILIPVIIITAGIFMQSKLNTADEEKQKMVEYYSHIEEYYSHIKAFDIEIANITRCNGIIKKRQRNCDKFGCHLITTTVTCQDGTVYNNPTYIIKDTIWDNR